MSLITMYKCDKCGIEDNKPSRFWDIQLKSSDEREEIHMHICRPCWAWYVVKETT